VPRAASSCRAASNRLACIDLQRASFADRMSSVGDTRRVSDVRREASRSTTRNRRRAAASCHIRSRDRPQRPACRGTRSGGRLACACCFRLGTASQLKTLPAKPQHHRFSRPAASSPQWWLGSGSLDVVRLRYAHRCRPAPATALQRLRIFASTARRTVDAFRSAPHSTSAATFKPALPTQDLPRHTLHARRCALCATDARLPRAASRARPGPRP